MFMTGVLCTVCGARVYLLNLDLLLVSKFVSKFFNFV